MRTEYFTIINYDIHIIIIISQVIIKSYETYVQVFLLMRVAFLDNTVAVLYEIVKSLIL